MNGRVWLIALVAVLFLLLAVLLWREFYTQPKILKFLSEVPKAESIGGVESLTLKRIVSKKLSTPPFIFYPSKHNEDVEIREEISILKIPAVKVPFTIERFEDKKIPKTKTLALLNLGLLQTWDSFSGYCSLTPAFLVYKGFKPSIGMTYKNKIYLMTGLEKRLFEIAEASNKETITYISLSGYWIPKLKRPYFGVSTEIKWDI